MSLQALGALNGINFRTGALKGTEVPVYTQPLKNITSPTFSLSHPRCNDSEGVVNESPLAKRLDYIS